jgi:hypothetical protein
MSSKVLDTTISSTGDIVSYPIKTGTGTAPGGIIEVVVVVVVVLVVVVVGTTVVVLVVVLVVVVVVVVGISSILGVDPGIFDLLVSILAS